MRSARVSVTLPPEYAGIYAAVAAKLGISRSALLAGLLMDLADELAPVANALASVEGGSAKRARGKSMEAVEEAVVALQRQLDTVQAELGELFPASRKGRG